MFRQPTDSELVEACKRQSRKAQQQLYERFSGRMLGICMRYLKDRMEAEDMLVGGFLKVFDKIGQYEGSGSFEGWLRRVFVNECLMFLRKQNRLTIPIEDAPPVAASEVDLPLSHMQAEDLLQMIQRLPPGYQTVFNLYAIEGYGHKEIAEKLGISEGTSKSQLNRARKMLQEWMVNREMVN